MSPTHKGLFIEFAGGEGAGKTTQCEKLVDALGRLGISTLLTREPGGTEFGKIIRKILLDREGQPLTKRTEMLLFAADRSEHVESVLKSGLDKFDVVVTDRYSASTIAYQGYANGLGMSDVGFISEWASDGRRPNIVFFLDIEPRIGLERAMRVERTRFEDKSAQYHYAVRDGFVEQMDSSWVRIDAHGSEDKIHEQILERVLFALAVRGQVVVPASASKIERIKKVRLDQQTNDIAALSMLCYICHKDLIPVQGEPWKWYCDREHSKIVVLLTRAGVQNVQMPKSHAIPKCGACGLFMRPDEFNTNTWFCNSSPYDGAHPVRYQDVDFPVPADNKANTPTFATIPNCDVCGAKMHGRFNRHDNGTNWTCPHEDEHAMQAGADPEPTIVRNIDTCAECGKSTMRASANESVCPDGHGFWNRTQPKMWAWEQLPLLKDGSSVLFCQKVDCDYTTVSEPRSNTGDKIKYCKNGHGSMTPFTNKLRRKR